MALEELSSGFGQKAGLNGGVKPRLVLEPKWGKGFGAPPDEIPRERAMTVGKDTLLIAELKSKFAAHDTSNFIVSDFLAAFGSPLDSVMYLRLFWPEFIRFEGMVFREETLENDEDRRQVHDTLLRYSEDRTRTEQSFNLVEVPSGIFSGKLSEGSDEIDKYLAEKLVELWSCRLAATFPDEDFVVKTLSAKVTGGERGVIFYMRRGSA